VKILPANVTGYVNRSLFLSIRFFLSRRHRSLPPVAPLPLHPSRRAVPPRQHQPLPGPPAWVRSAQPRRCATRSCSHPYSSEANASSHPKHKGSCCSQREWGGGRVRQGSQQRRMDGDTNVLTQVLLHVLGCRTHGCQVLDGVGDKLAHARQRTPGSSSPAVDCERPRCIGGKGTAADARTASLEVVSMVAYANGRQRALGS
jgi:hypothetical protein